MTQYDIIIIGNGILALSIAFELQHREPCSKICIIGPENRAGSASLAAGAMLGCFGEITHASMKSAHGLKKIELAYKAKKVWQAWINKILEQNKQSLLNINFGTQIILNSKSGHLDDLNFEAIKNNLQNLNEPYIENKTFLDKEINPINSARPIRNLFIPNEGFINPNALLSELINALKKNNNISFVNDHAIFLKKVNNRLSYIETEKKEFIAGGKFILAAGAFCKEIVEKSAELKESVPMILYGSGTSLIIDYKNHGRKHVFRSPNRAGACGIHVVPYEIDKLYVGATNNLFINPVYKPKTRDIYYLLERLLEQYDKSLYGNPINSWVIGNRPVTIDMYPLIGKTVFDNLWLATGSYRDGLHDSPIIAEMMADFVLNDIQSSEFCLFSPTRKPIINSSIFDSIDDFTLQMTSATYEHGISLPKFGVEERLIESWTRKVEYIYEKLNIDFGIPTDVLIMLNHEPNLIPFFKNYYKKVFYQFTDISGKILVYEPV